MRNILVHDAEAWGESAGNRLPEVFQLNRHWPPSASEKVGKIRGSCTIRGSFRDIAVGHYQFPDPQNALRVHRRLAEDAPSLRIDRSGLPDISQFLSSCVKDANSPCPQAL